MIPLKPFQRECVDKMLSFLNKRKAVYNACEMRLGKCCQSIATCEELLSSNNLKQILVICPAIVRLVWQQEISKFTPERKTLVIHSSKELPKIFDIGMYTYIIISYELASKDEFLKWCAKKMSKDILIIDEAHYLSSLKAIRTKQILRKLWPQFGYKIALSGTPFRNSIVDAYPVFNKIAPELVENKFIFANQFTHAKHNGFGVTYTGVKNEEALRRLMYDNFFVRKTKKQVITQLPSKQAIKVPLEESYAVRMTAEEKALMAQYRKELEEILRKGVALESIKPPPISLMKIRREQGLKKVAPVVEYIKNLLEQNVKVVVMCVFRDVIAAYQEAFKEYDPVIIHGDISQKAREAGLHKFKNTDCQLFIGQMVACGVGINLSESSDIVFPEYNYSVVDLTQAIARVESMDKKDSINLHYFVVEKSTDEKVIDAIMKKAETFGAVL